MSIALISVIIFLILFAFQKETLRQKKRAEQRKRKTNIVLQRKIELAVTEKIDAELDALKSCNEREAIQALYQKYNFPSGESFRDSPIRVVANSAEELIRLISIRQMKRLGYQYDFGNIGVTEKLRNMLCDQGLTIKGRYPWL